MLGNGSPFRLRSTPLAMRRPRILLCRAKASEFVFNSAIRSWFLSDSSKITFLLDDASAESSMSS